jgi:hypothetical protein
MAASTKWRIYVTDSWYGWVSLSLLEMYTSVGGANQCTGGTATASSEFAGCQASNAFDGNSATVWSNATDTSIPAWIQYEFATSKDIVAIKMTPNTTYPDQSPLAFLLQYWDGAGWVTAIDVTTTMWTAAESKNFFVTYAAKSKWRVNITNVANASDITALALLEMYITVGGANQLTGGAINASSVDATYPVETAPYWVLDANTATLWVNDGTLPCWIDYSFSGPVEIVSFKMQADADDPTTAPEDFSLQYWDGSGWVTAWSKTGESAWSAGEIRTYSPLMAYLTGTALASITEADIVTGGKTIIITLANDTWIPASP